MNLEQLYEIAPKLNLGRVEELNGWLMCACPLAPWRPAHKSGHDSNPSFGIKIEEDGGTSHFNCFTCKSRGELSSLANLLSGYLEEPELREVAAEIRHIELFDVDEKFGDYDDGDTKIETGSSYRVTEFPDERRFDRYPSIFSSPAAVRYLAGRQVSFDTVIRCRLRFDPRQQRILFPVYDYWTGRYCGCSGRSILGDAERDAIRAGNPRDPRGGPKVRDYAGLPKDRLLLFAQRNVGGHGSHAGNGRGRRAQFGHGAGTYIIGCEGLFAFLRLQGLGFGACTGAILGSSVTPGKLDILRDIGKAVYWFTDDDPAGHDCLYGTLDKNSGNRTDNGVLNKLYGEVAQFIPTWPEGKDDPDQLTSDEVMHMIDTAELYLK